MRKALLWNRKGVYLVILVALLVSLVAIAVVQKLGTGSTGGPLGYAISLIRPALVQADTTTFPVDEAGIAAYVKLDSVDITDLTEALSFYSSVTKQASTYVIGTVQVPNVTGPNYPHVYIGLDGWIVAYYLNTEEASRIMQWNGYEKGIITTTTLKDAIDIMCTSIGVNYSTGLNYYDFEFPSANRMTLIAETMPDYGWDFVPDVYNSFSVTIPGVLYEGSYSIYAINRYIGNHLVLIVDGTTIFDISGAGYDWSYPTAIHYGYYDPATQLEVDEPHLVSLYEGCAWGESAATVLIYQK
jgi:hypothetical protein